MADSVPEVNVRLPEEDLAYLRGRGEDVGRVVRVALREHIDWLRFEDAQKRLQVQAFPASRPSAETIREDRDQAH